MRVLPFLLLGLLTSCSDEKDTTENGTVEADTDTDTDADTDADTDTDTDTDTDVECTAALVSHTPDPGTAGIRIDSSVVMTLSSPDPDASVVLETESGEPISGSGSWSNDGLVYTYTPDAYLVPETRYAASLSWCTGNDAFTFLTGNPDDLPPDASDVEGRTFYTDLDDATWEKPPGIGLVMAQGDLIGILFSMTDISEDKGTMQIQFGFTELTGANQDYCAQTLNMEADYSLAPWFSYEVEALDLSYLRFTIPLQDVRIQGKLAYAGDEVEELAVEAFVDARELIEVFDYALDIDDPDEVCKLLGALGGSCQTCDDGEEYCSPVKATGLTASTAVQNIDEVEQANCHEQCPTSDRNPECEL